MMKSTFSSSGEESSLDMFSPIHARHQSLHNNFDETDDDDTPQTPQHQIHTAAIANSLPRLADTSWIGARVSPIPSVDEDEETASTRVDMEAMNAPYRKAMQDFGAHERSALLGRRIHPLWGKSSNSFKPVGANKTGTTGSQANTIRDPWSEGTFDDPNQASTKSGLSEAILARWGRLLVMASALHLFAVGLHDAYFLYIIVRRGSQVSSSAVVGKWIWPWAAPSTKVLLRFGAYCPSKIRWNHQWYRIATSWIIVGSVLEWLVTAFAWWRLDKVTARTIAKPGLPPQNVGFETYGALWILLFLLSIGTGMLWTAAFGSPYAISGCLGWGTAAILCAVGSLQPEYRLDLFSIAIVLLLLNLVQPTSSVFGAIGASFFGWSASGVVDGLSTNLVLKEHPARELRNFGPVHWLAAITSSALWFIPIAHLLILKK